MFALATRKTRKTIGSLVIAIAGWTAAPAEAAELKATTIGLWKSSPASGSSSTGVSPCALQTANAEGLTVRLSLNSQQQWTLSFTKSGWNSTIGGGQRFYLKVDNGPFFKSTALVDGHHMAHTEVPTKGGLFRALLRGHVLKIASDTTTASIRLESARQVIEFLKACASFESMNKGEMRISRGRSPDLSPKS